jgi:hypothetical protein
VAIFQSVQCSKGVSTVKILLRQGLAGCFALLAIVFFSCLALADDLDSIPIDPQATVLCAEQTVVAPANGAVGSPVSVTSRAFVSIDFAVQPGKQVTLVVLSSAQKQQMDAGQPIEGRPRVRAPIDGVASQSITVDPGEYYVAILNADAQPVSITYRVSARAF